MYPFLVYIGLNSGYQFLLGCGLVVIGAARFFLGLYGAKLRGGEKLISLAMLMLGLFVLVKGSGQFLLFYPVIISVCALLVSGFSLMFPPTFVERIARLKHPDMDMKMRHYCTRVTQIWCGFFTVNAAIALWTIVSEDRELWLFYNGVISYILMGVLFAGEFGVRTFLKHKRERDL